MNVATLKEELMNRGIKPTSKHKKADMQKMLRTAVNDSILFFVIFIIIII